MITRTSLKSKEHECTVPQWPKGGRSGGGLAEDNMLIGRRKRGTHNSEFHPTLGDGPSDRLAGMVRRRWKAWLVEGTLERKKGANAICLFGYVRKRGQSRFVGLH